MLRVWISLVLLFVELRSYVIVNRGRIKIVPWKEGTTNISFPFNTTLYLSSQLVEPLNVSCVVLYNGLVKSTYLISREFRTSLERFQEDPKIVAVVVMDGKASPGFFSWYLFLPEEIKIPVWLVGKNDIELDWIPQEGIGVEVVGMDENDWNKRGAGYTFWVWSLVFGYGVGFVLAIFNLVALVHLKKITIISSLCLVFELCGLVLRINDLIFEWWLTSTEYVKVLWTISFPFLLAASALLVFFWLEITSEKSTINNDCLYVMKIPATIVIILLFINEIILDVLNFYFEIYITNAMYIIYGLLSFGLGVLYLVVSQKISNFLEVYERKDDFKRALQVMNIKAKICGVAFICVFIFGMIIYFGGSEYPILWRFWWYLFNFAVILIQFLQISIFSPSREVLKYFQKHKSNVVILEYQ